MLQPFFSIIIPTYNRALHLLNAIQSVQNQSFQSFEIIVMDDGSSDSTKDVVFQLIQEDKRISYFYQSNSERAIARNNGAKKAIGANFIFLDSDDSFCGENHLQNIFDFIKSQDNKIALFFTGATIVSSETNYQTRNIEVEELKEIDYFIHESVIPARVCLPSVFMQEFQFDPDCIIVEDTVLWTLILDKYPVQYIPIHSVTYNIHEGNSVNISNKNAYALRLKGLNKLFQVYPVGKKISKSTRVIHINRCFLGISEYYYYKGLNFVSLSWLLYSLLRFPRIEVRYKIKKILTFRKYNNIN